jgi:predicted deacylase
MPADKPARRPPLTIAGKRIKRGETCDLRLQFSESYTGLSISVPLRVIAAPKRGPVVFMTALVHGDELNGLGILRELLLEQPLNLTRGTVIAVPAVNVYGLEAHSRYLPDRRDLNRSFPGTSTGSLTSRLAHTVFNEIVSKCDYGIDFHTAAQGRTNFPNVRGGLSNPEVKDLARAFGAGLIVDGDGPDGSLRAEAVKAGVPTIILEAGETWKIEPGIVELGVRGATNVLKRLDMMEGDPMDPPFQSLIRKTAWLRAERGGVLKYHVAPGEVVKKDQLLAVNLDIFGGEQNRLISPVDGVILGMSTMPLAKPGDAIFHIGVAPESVGRLERRMSRPKGQGLHRRIKRHLATNILVKDPDENEPSDSQPASSG